MKKSMAGRVVEMLEWSSYEEDDGIWEMSTLDPPRTSLSRPIWVDDSGVTRNIPHSPYRIKVQARKGEPFHTRTNAISIYFDKEEPYIDPTYRGKHDIKGWEFKKIINFLKKHRDLLAVFYSRKIGEHDTVWLINEIEKRKSITNNYKKKANVKEE